MSRTSTATQGEAGLEDQPSRPHSTPHRTPADIEAKVCELRQTRKLGPARIGPILNLPPSTVHRVLVRHGLNRLAFMDRPTGTVIRRYERERPGELVHVDIKKLGNIPDGGGHRVMARQAGEADQRSPSGTPNRTPLDEWAYLQPYASNTERAEALKTFLHTYNYHRCHTALGGQPPITRVNNPGPIQLGRAPCGVALWRHPKPPAPIRCSQTRRTPVLWNLTC